MRVGFWVHIFWNAWQSFYKPDKSFYKSHLIWCLNHIWAQPNQQKGVTFICWRLQVQQIYLFCFSFLLSTTGTMVCQNIAEVPTYSSFTENSLILIITMPSQ
jgi:hypothetical protein